MVHETLLCKLKPGQPPEVAEQLMVETRMRLLKIPGILHLACGKAIQRKGNPYDFFAVLHFENLAKRQAALDSAVFVKYKVQILEPYVAHMESLLFEMEPGKDVQYS
jgi:hypothetical protein